MKSATQLAEGMYYIGANIDNDDLFEGLWPIPHGVSLNSYLVKGEKNAFIDLVRDWDEAPVQLKSQMDSLDLTFDDIDYLILNHLEPDHTGWLGEFHRKFPKAEIVTTKKGAALVEAFYQISDVTVVKTGDTLDLGGGKILTFVEIPNVHWPETMVTYDASTGILFSCDAFGSYGKLSDRVFDDQLSEDEHQFFEKESLRYYANIVASFSTFVERAIAKLADVEVKMICPSHGIIWRENPKVIIDRYIRYASYLKGPAEPEITLIWGSMYGNTQIAVNKVIEAVRSAGVKIHVHQVPQEELSYILASAWRSQGIILGMPTYEYKMFPPMANALDILARKHVHHRNALRFGSFGWSGGAQKELDQIMETNKMKWEFEEPVEFNGLPKEDDLNKLFEAAKAFAQKIKESARVD